MCLCATGHTFSWKTKQDSRAVACSTVRSLKRPLNIISVSRSSSPLERLHGRNDCQSFIQSSLFSMYLQQIPYNAEETLSILKIKVMTLADCLLSDMDTYLSRCSLFKSPTHPSSHNRATLCEGMQNQYVLIDPTATSCQIHKQDEDGRCDSSSKVKPLQLDRPLMADCSTPRGPSSAITLNSTQAKVKTFKLNLSHRCFLLLKVVHVTLIVVHFSNQFSLDQ